MRRGVYEVGGEESEGLKGRRESGLKAGEDADFRGSIIFEFDGEEWMGDFCLQKSDESGWKRNEEARY